MHLCPICNRRTINVLDDDDDDDDDDDMMMIMIMMTNDDHIVTYSNAVVVTASLELIIVTKFCILNLIAKGYTEFLSKNVL